MAGDLERQADTPADVAQKEAARQAVALLFGIAGALAMIPIYKRIARSQVEVLREVMPHDSTMQEVERRQAEATAAAAAVRRQVRNWHKVAGMLWPVSTSAALWALRRAENVSKRSRKQATP